MNYIIALLLIGGAILVHELGHFIAARMAGVPVRVLSIGFGRKLWSVRRGCTEYRISIIPLGGYVMPDCDDDKDFLALPRYKRIIMTAGGPVASMILPVFCFALANLFTAGFSFDGLFIKPLFQTGDVFGKMITSFMGMFTQHNQLSGIIGIVSQGGRFIGISLVKSLQFMGLISLNLALVNLVPLPVLDGGKIVLYCMEGLHPRFMKLHYPLAIAGWVLIMGLMLYTTAVDVIRLT